MYWCYRAPIFKSYSTLLSSRVVIERSISLRTSEALNCIIHQLMKGRGIGNRLRPRPCSCLSRNLSPVNYAVKRLTPVLICQYSLKQGVPLLVQSANIRLRCSKCVVIVSGSVNMWSLHGGGRFTPAIFRSETVYFWFGIPLIWRHIIESITWKLMDMYWSI